jgi:hypothetical protein
MAEPRQERRLGVGLCSWLSLLLAFAHTLIARWFCTSASFYYCTSLLLALPTLSLTTVPHPTLALPILSLTKVPHHSWPSLLFISHYCTSPFLNFVTHHCTSPFLALPYFCHSSLYLTIPGTPLLLSLITVPHHPWHALTFVTHHCTSPFLVLPYFCHSPLYLSQSWYPLNFVPYYSYHNKTVSCQ